MSSKQRLDVFLVENGLCQSREKAKALIIAGEVTVDGATVHTPSKPITSVQHVEMKQPPAFVSRGGHKLAKALDVFGIDLTGRTCADLGASTGGFTDCMLKHGAAHVYAVDVGYGQLAWPLRNDPRVTSLEKTNARYLKELPAPADFVTMDLSFISILQVLPAAMRISASGASIVALIKPQFEAGKERVGKKGVVRDAATHVDVLQTVGAKASDLGLVLADVTFSPIKGPNGNIEFPSLFVREGTPASADCLRRVVEAAHQQLK